MFEVECWGSEPDTNDDNYSCIEFSSKKAAIKAMNLGVRDSSIAYLRLIQVEGDKVTIIIPEMKNHCFVPDNTSLSDWENEIAMEAGMLHGIDAYNDAKVYY